MSLQKKEWSMAYKNVGRNKRRSWAFFLAMTFTVVGLTMLGGHLYRTESLLRTVGVYFSKTGHVAIYKKDGSLKFSQSPKKYYLKNDRLSAIIKILERPYYQKKVDFYGAFLEGMGIINHGTSSTPFLASGVDPQIYAKIFQHKDVLMWTHELDLTIPYVDFNAALKIYAAPLSLTKNMALLLGLNYPVQNGAEVQIGARNIYGDLNALTATYALNHTTGIAMAEDTSLLMPLSTLQELMAIEGASHLSLFLHQSLETPIVINQLKKDLKDYADLEILPFYDERIGEIYLGSMGFFTVMALFFIVMIYSAGLLSLANVVSMNIIERTKEIGTLRSLGFNRHFIARIFMKETLIISFFSIFAGNILIFLLSSFINSLHIKIYPPYIPGAMNFYLFSNWEIKIWVAIPLIIISALFSYYFALYKNNQKISALLSEATR